MKLSLWTKTQSTVKGVLGTLFLILCSFGAAHATHLAAADISVKYIGSAPGQCVPIFTYEVTLDVYKACEPPNADLSATESVSISSPSGCFAGIINLSMTVTPDNIDTLDQLCLDAKQFSSCRMPAGSPQAKPGFVRHRYVGTVSLPQACSDWTFAWDNGNRNGGIKNLQTPLNTDIYISCMINNVYLPTVSTPKFTIDPTPFLCIGKPSIFLNGPTTQDRDSTTLEVVPVSAKTATGGGSPLLYEPGYSPANPVGSPTGYKVNPQTGSTQFVAPIGGKYVLAFRLNKYKNGVLVSYVERDVQIAVLPCVGDVPTITDTPKGISGGYLVQSGDSGNIVTVCPGSTLRFNLSGYSPSPNAMLGMDDTLGERIGTFSSVGQPNATGAINRVLGIFEYTPQPGDEGEYTKIFAVSDTSCGQSGEVIVQKNYVSVLIKVPAGIEAGADGYYCPTGGGKGYQISVTSSDSNTRYAWAALPGGAGLGSLSCTDCLNPLAKPDSNTTYVITALRTPFLCKVKDTISIEVNRIKTIPDEEVVVCRPGFLQLDAIVTGKKLRQDIRCNYGPMAACVTPGTADTARIGFCTDATGSTVQQTPFRTANASVHTQMIFQRQELINGGLSTGTIRSLSFYVDGTPSTAPLENFKVSMSCTNRNSYNGDPSFTTGLAQVLNTPALPALDTGWNTITFDRPYNWDTSQNLIVDICFNNTTFTPGSVSTEVQYSETGAQTVLQSVSNTTNVCQIAGSPSASVNRPNIRFAYCKPEDSAFKVYWRPGTYLQDSNVVNPIAYVPKSYTVYAEVVGYQNCISRDSLNIILAEDTVYATPADSLICPGDAAILKSSPRDYYKWYQDNYKPATTLDCDTCQRVIAHPERNTDYILVGYNYWGKDKTVCADTFTASVRLKTTERVKLTPKETTIKYGDAVPLYANGANVYHWTPGNGLSNTVGAAVMASPMKTTQYIVTGIGLDGCQTSDTATVTVDPRTLVVVPNAFTPNGDSKNDYFAPQNLTTRRVVEFRVFNRWGQQMFNASGNTPGWDGTFDGEPQGAGTYSYIIRTTSPDGQSETFKGDVILIR